MTNNIQFESDSIHRVVVRRALAAQDPAKLQLYFEVAVLDKYRETPGFSLVRTNTVGRIKKEGGWSLDFGIAPGELQIHASIGDLIHIPEADREHWSQFSTALPASRMFLQMRLSPAACLDDGDLRSW
jgi:hypothetical protein